MTGFSFIHRVDTIIIASLLFAGMVLTVKLGRLIERSWVHEDTDSKGGMNSLRTSILGLFSFILAFTFGISSSRYDSIRIIFADEANYIGTAILRSDLYVDSVRDAFRADFRNYLEARIALYSSLGDTSVVRHSRERSAASQQRLWKRTTDQSKLPNMLIPSNNMVTALNNMFDIGKKREILLKTPIPDVVIYVLLTLALVCSFICGVTSSNLKRRDWILIFCFSIFTSLIIFITLELGRPLRGHIQARASADAILEVRKLLE
mgnify:CR=1 FL=1